MINPIFIPGNVPSLKNSKQIVKRGNKPLLIPSKRHTQYAKETKARWMECKQLFADMKGSSEKPLVVGMYFTRGSKHSWDYDNAISTVQDLMVSNEWIPDDNSDEIMCVPLGYHYDKNNPGVYIQLLDGGFIKKWMNYGEGTK